MNSNNNFFNFKKTPIMLNWPLPLRLLIQKVMQKFCFCCFMQREYMIEIQKSPKCLKFWFSL